MLSLVTCRINQYIDDKIFSLSLFFLPVVDCWSPHLSDCMLKVIEALVYQGDIWSVIISSDKDFTASWTRCYPSAVLANSFFFLKIYLETKSEKETDSNPPSAGSPSPAGPGPGRSQEPRAPSGSSTGWQDPRYFGHLPMHFPGTCKELD